MTIGELLAAPLLPSETIVTSTQVTMMMAAENNISVLTSCHEDGPDKDRLGVVGKPIRTVTSRRLPDICILLGDETMVGGRLFEMWQALAENVHVILKSKIKSLCGSLFRKKTDPEVELVVVSFSTKGCSNRVILEEQWQRLIDQVKKTYPSATILMTSVLLQARHGRKWEVCL